MSGSLNQVTLIGRLGRDPEIRSGQSGVEVANFTIATDETWKDKSTGEKRERTEWHRIVVFGTLVQIVQKYLNKGDLVVVQGKLQTRKWQDQEGIDRYTTEVVLDQYNGRLTMLGGSKGSSGGNSDRATSNQASKKPVVQDDDDDEIPF
jgi:single-strand DNA-binding protein